MTLNENQPDPAATDDTAAPRTDASQDHAPQADAPQGGAASAATPEPSTDAEVTTTEASGTGGIAPAAAPAAVDADDDAAQGSTEPEGSGASEDAEVIQDEEASAESAESQEERVRRLEEEGDIAADYLEELLDITDLDGDIDIDVDGDRASVEIRGANRMAELNRPKGELLDALQELSRLAVQTRTGNRSRLMLDIGGFRAEHKDSLEQLAATAIAEAKESGAPVPMRPMNPFERKVVHDVAKEQGLRSESDGDGKNRHVVIYPAS